MSDVSPREAAANTVNSVGKHTGDVYSVPDAIALAQVHALLHIGDSIQLLAAAIVRGDQTPPGGG